MDEHVRDLLTEIYARGRAHDAVEPLHARRYLNLDTETAELMAGHIAGEQRMRILEIGTSNGYSTIWLASALPPGGHIDSIERDPAKIAEAGANLDRAGFGDRVTLHQGDATEVIEWFDGPFDCVFFDADRTSAPVQLALLLPMLSPDVTLFCDNIQSHPDEVSGYLKMVAALPGFEHSELAIGKGLSIARRQGPVVS